MAVMAGTTVSTEYAGFWKRVAAYIVDAILVNVVAGILYKIAPPLGSVGGLLGIAYFVYMESSEAQATFGKQLLGIKVTDLDGNRISVGRAIGRNLAKFLSAVIFLIGFIMVAFTAKKQGLHDMIASTLVVNK